MVQTKGAYDVRFHLEPTSSYSVNPPQNFLAAGPGESASLRTGLESDECRRRETSSSISPASNTASAARPVKAARIKPASSRADLQQHALQRVQSVLSGDAQSGGHAAAAQEFRNERDEARSSSSRSSTPIPASLRRSSTRRRRSRKSKTTYWDLVGAWRNVAIQEEAVKEAIAQQQSNVRLAQRGVAAPIDAVESQTQVSNFQDNVFRRCNGSRSCRISSRVCRVERAGPDLERESGAVDLGARASER